MSPGDPVSVVTNAGRRLAGEVVRVNHATVVVRLGDGTLLTVKKRKVEA